MNIINLLINWQLTVAVNYTCCEKIVCRAITPYLLCWSICWSSGHQTGQRTKRIRRSNRTALLVMASLKRNEEMQTFWASLPAKVKVWTSQHTFIGWNVRTNETIVYLHCAMIYTIDVWTEPSMAGQSRCQEITAFIIGMVPICSAVCLAHLGWLCSILVVGMWFPESWKCTRICTMSC